MRKTVASILLPSVVALAAVACSTRAILPPASGSGVRAGDLRLMSRWAERSAPRRSGEPWQVQHKASLA
jgi:hypothetical protein